MFEYVSLVGVQCIADIADLSAPWFINHFKNSDFVYTLKNYSYY